MDGLKFDGGGISLFGDDIEFLQSSLTDAIQALAKGLVTASDGRLIVTGCVPSITATQVSITEGWVVINDTLRFLPATTKALQAGTTIDECWIITTQTFEMAITTEDNTQTHLYKLLRAGIDCPPRAIPSNAWTLDQFSETSPYRLTNFLKKENLSLTFENGFSAAFGSPNIVQNTYFGKTVQVWASGHIPAQDGESIAELPLAMRPSADVYSVVMTSIGIANVRIAASTGKIWVGENAPFTSGNCTLFLNLKY